MTDSKPPTAVEKRAHNPTALARFQLRQLQQKLPLVFPADATLPPSPKPHYRSAYRYLGTAELNADSLQVFSVFDISVQLFDYSALEPRLAAQLYVASAKGQVPFHPVSMYLLSLYRRERHLSRHGVLRLLRHPTDGQALRHWTGFVGDVPSESGLRYFEGQLTPELQQEISALQLDVLYQAGLLPPQPGAVVKTKVSLAFDGMLHQARSRLRCSSVAAACYQPAPRPCRAKEKGKQGCDCQDEACATRCGHATPRDPQARLVVYTGRNKRAAASPNTPVVAQNQRPAASRMVYGYYSYAGQLLDDDCATYWILPATFGPATTGDATLFPANFAYLRARFPWLDIGEVLADAGAGEQPCLEAIWQAGALRLVDIRAHPLDTDPDTQLARGYNEQGHPLCPLGYVLRSNGYDYQRRRAKWRCAKQCQRDSDRPVPDCDYQQASYKHGYTTTVGRAHADGSVRLAREIPYGSPAWKHRYHRRNAAESRNSAQERLGLKRLPQHGFQPGHVAVMQADFVTNQATLVRLIRQATARS